MESKRQQAHGGGKKKIWIGLALVAAAGVGVWSTFFGGEAAVEEV